jgi:hypothetical protein
VANDNTKHSNFEPTHNLDTLSVSNKTYLTVSAIFNFAKVLSGSEWKSGDAISLIAGATASGAALAVVKQQPREEDGLMIREKGGGGGGGPSGL